MNRFMILGVFLATATACGESGPVVFTEGTFELRELNGSSLPYDHEGLGCCTYLDGSLELNNGAYVLEVTARNRNTGVVFTAREAGSFTQEDGTLTFVRESFEIQPLLLGQAAVSGQLITLSFGGEGPGSPDQFRAVFQRV